MKIILFAGGSGTRFWPISRNKYPKQFIPLINNKSTIARLLDDLSEWYGWNQIYVPTTELLAALVKNNFPSLPLNHIITEPVRRDLAPAVGLAMITLAKHGAGSEPTTILWSDGYIGNKSNFKKALSVAESFIKKDPNKLLFLGEKPAYPNENLGWIKKGKIINKDNGLIIYEKAGFVYRPKLEDAKQWFEKDTHLWNPGYFVTTPNFIIDQYKTHQPEMYQQLMTIQKALDTDQESDVLAKIYPSMESISFDDAILEKMDDNLSLVLGGEYNWADPGTLYALKQFLQENEDDNVTKGLVYNFQTKDSLVYNFVKKQIVTTIGLDGYIVVNTPDAVLVCHKNQIPTIKAMLKEFENTELEKFL